MSRALAYESTLGCHCREAPLLQDLGFGGTAAAEVDSLVSLTQFPFHVFRHQQHQSASIPSRNVADERDGCSLVLQEA